MPIYTKTGDKGKTSLFGGKRIDKHDMQVEAYGAVDEATSFIGFAVESLTDKKDTILLRDIQMNLYSVMAYLSSGPFEKEKVAAHIAVLETSIDQLEKSLPKLTRFILPQGSESTSRLHLARVMVRSAERRVARFIDTTEYSASDHTVLQYLNRLSDFLFMLARKYTKTEYKT